MIIMFVPLVAGNKTFAEIGLCTSLGQIETHPCDNAGNRLDYRQFFTGEKAAMDMTIAALTPLVPLREVLSYACIRFPFRPVLVHT